MLPDAKSHVRIARPSRDLVAAERFWVRGLGLQVLWRSGRADEVEGGHALLMLGWPTGCWHLELVGDPCTNPAPSEEDLLVLYVGGALDAEVEQRVVDAGGRRVRSRNPYWEREGITFTDPDGYRLVLSHRTWS